MAEIGPEEDDLGAVAQKLVFDAPTIVLIPADEDGSRSQARDAAHGCLSNPSRTTGDKGNSAFKIHNYLLLCEHLRQPDANEVTSFATCLERNFDFEFISHLRFSEYLPARSSTK
jgi:hypothetical protein